MINKKYILYIFIFVMVLQYLVPAHMVYENEKILKYGSKFIIKAKSIGPYYNSSGRFIKVYAEPEYFDVAKDFKVPINRNIYLLIKKDDEKLSYFSGFSLKRPSSHTGWIRAKIKYSLNKKLYYSLPFDKYYINEDDAKELKRFFDRSLLIKNKDGTIGIKVLDGRAIVCGVFIKDIPIIKYMKDNKKVNE